MTQPEQEKVLHVRDCWKTVGFQPLVGWVNLYGVSRTDTDDGCNIAFYYVVPCPGMLVQEFLGTATTIKRGERFSTRYEPVQDEWARVEDSGEQLTRVVPAVINSDTATYNGQLEPAGQYDSDCKAIGYRQYLMTLPEYQVQDYILAHADGFEDISDLLIDEAEAHDKWRSAIAAANSNIS